MGRKNSTSKKKEDDPIPPPIVGDGESHQVCSKKGLSCLTKLKCSSRASKEENFRTSASVSAILPSLDLEEKKEDGIIVPAVDYIPKDDNNDDDHDGIINRIASEDTHDTPPVSNIDPRNNNNNNSSNNNKSNIDGSLSLKERTLKLDAICSKYFNTPVGQTPHTTTPLGDEISPVEDEDNPYHQYDRSTSFSSPSSSSSDKAKSLLQIPTMSGIEEHNNNNNNNTSSSSSLMLNADNASMKIGYQEVKAKNRRTIMARPLSEQSTATQSDVFSSDSSYSTVSSFSFISNNTPLQQQQQQTSSSSSPTPYAFFWRTHPNSSSSISSSSSSTYNNISYNKGQSSFIRSERRKNDKVQQRGMEKIDEEITVLEISSSGNNNGNNNNNNNNNERGNSNNGRTTYVITDDQKKKGPSCGTPFLHPEVVRKLWMESNSQPFRVVDVVDPTTTTSSSSSSSHHWNTTSRCSSEKHALASFRTQLPAIFNRVYARHTTQQQESHTV